MKSLVVLFTARAVEMVFPLTTISGWAFDVEVLYFARRHGLRMMRDVLRIKANAMRGVYDETPRSV